MRMTRVMAYLAIFATLFAGAAAWQIQDYRERPNHLHSETTLIIPKGTGAQAIAQQLGQAGVIRWPQLFLAMEYATQRAARFKAGEYQFPPGITPNDVSTMLVQGKVVVHQITIPEGWSSAQIRAALEAEPILSGTITRPMPEGSLLPETYQFTYGDRRDGLVERMQNAMTRALNEAWERRTSNLPLANKEALLILASIVEKETGLAEERPRVAGVFINRLRQGMRLQTDPSVIYGLEQALGTPLARPLTKADLERETPYNTYLIPGLPPNAIANPGRAALQATAQPLATQELYFVATGEGGHAFATNLADHNRNVTAYKRYLATQP